MDDQGDMPIGPSKFTTITAGRTDQQKAEDIRKKLLELLAPVSAVLGEAAIEGFLVNFQFGPPDSFKRVHLANLEILKKLC